MADVVIWLSGAIVPRDMQAIEARNAEKIAGGMMLGLFAYLNSVMWRTRWKSTSDSQQ